MVMTLLAPATPAGAQAPLTVDNFGQITSWLAAGAPPHDGGFRSMTQGGDISPGVSGIVSAGTGLLNRPPAIFIDFAERGDLPGNITAHPGDRNFGAAFDQTHVFFVRFDGPFASGPTHLQESGIQFYDPNGNPLLPDPSFPFGVGEGTTSLTALVHSPAQSGSIFGLTNNGGRLDISLNGYTIFEVDAPTHTDLVFLGPVSADWAAYNSGSDEFSPTDPATFDNVGAQITERQPPATAVTNLADLEPASGADDTYLLGLASFYEAAGLPVPTQVSELLVGEDPAGDPEQGGAVVETPAEPGGDDPVSQPAPAQDAPSENAGGEIDGESDGERSEPDESGGDSSDGDDGGPPWREIGLGIGGLALAGEGGRRYVKRHGDDESTGDRPYSGAPNYYAGFDFVREVDWKEAAAAELGSPIWRDKTWQWEGPAHSAEDLEPFVLVTRSPLTGFERGDHVAGWDELDAGSLHVAGWRPGSHPVLDLPPHWRPPGEAAGTPANTPPRDLDPEASFWAERIPIVVGVNEDGSDQVVLIVDPNNPHGASEEYRAREQAPQRGAADGPIDISDGTTPTIS